MEYLNFKDGNKMPIVGLGLGTWQPTDEGELEGALDMALAAGYRHFDTAYVYPDEPAFGKVLLKWLSSGRVKREDLFIVTKLPEIGMSPARVQHFLDLSLQALHLDYVDLYLIHSPIGFHYLDDSQPVPIKDGRVWLDQDSSLELVWQEMEAQVRAGRAKSIGVSNFSSSQIERIVKVAKIPVAAVQVELHVYFQQKELRETCKKHSIPVVAYAPLGSPGRIQIFGDTVEVPSVLKDPVISQIARAHRREPSQILLKFLTQQGIGVIPKSTNGERLKRNMSLFDFKLTEEELKTIGLLDREDGRSFGYGSEPGIEEHPEATF